MSSAFPLINYTLTVDKNQLLLNYVNGFTTEIPIGQVSIRKVPLNADVTTMSTTLYIISYFTTVIELDYTLCTNITASDLDDFLRQIEDSTKVDVNSIDLGTTTSSIYDELVILGTTLTSLNKNNNFDLQKMSFGLVSGTAIRSPRGTAQNFSSADGEIVLWDDNSNANFLSSAETIIFTSTSALDTLFSAGAWALNIVGLDDNWDEIEEILTMGGIAGVTSVNSYLRVFRVLVVATGPTNVNQGAISGTASSAGTLQSYITATDCINSSSVVSVPRGFVGYFKKVQVQGQGSMFQGGGPVIEFKLCFRNNNFPGPPIITVQKFVIDSSVQNSYDFGSDIMFNVDERSDVYITATTNSVDVRASSLIFAIMVPE